MRLLLMQVPSEMFKAELIMVFPSATVVVIKMPTFLTEEHLKLFLAHFLVVKIFIAKALVASHLGCSYLMAGSWDWSRDTLFYPLVRQTFASKGTVLSYHRETAFPSNS